MANMRPIRSEAEALSASDAIWRSLPKTAWDEAFGCHPRIGDREAPKSAAGVSERWSKEEQRSAMLADAAVTDALRLGNAQYENRFGRVFLVCAEGRSGSEILELLERRMGNDPEAELLEAAEQQRQITALRLRRWMEGR